MKSTFTRIVCRVLAAGMIVLPWQAQAGLIGTERAVAAGQGQDARGTVAAFVGREDVAGQLQLLGLAREEAVARVAALSDVEVAGLAGRIDALPAGGIAGVLPLIVVAVLFYYLVVIPDTTPKAAAKAPAVKPKPKPAAAKN
jgi:hypothetical protein